MSDQGYTPTTAELHGCSPEEWQEQMLTEVKVAYRVIETCGPPDVDAVPYDAEFTAQVDAEFDCWLAEVRREAAEKAWDRATDLLSAHYLDRVPSAVDRLERSNPYRNGATA